MVKIAIGVLIGFMLGLAGSAFGQDLTPSAFWSGLDSSGKTAYVLGVANGVIWLNNQLASGRDPRRIFFPYVAWCKSVYPTVVNRLDQYVQGESPVNMGDLTLAVVAAVAECGGATP